MSATVVLHPAAECLAWEFIARGFLLTNRRGKSGRSWLVLTRAGGNL